MKSASGFYCEFIYQFKNDIVNELPSIRLCAGDQVVCQFVLSTTCSAAWMLSMYCSISFRAGSDGYCSSSREERDIKADCK